MVEPHRHEGVFICLGKEDDLVTKNLVPGESVYGEKRVSISEGDDKIEYRAWNPFRSKLAAAILGGVDQIHIKPGAKVLYLGAASGTTVSHVSDIVGPVSGQVVEMRELGLAISLHCVMSMEPDSSLILWQGQLEAELFFQYHSWVPDFRCEPESVVSVKVTQR